MINTNDAVKGLLLTINYLQTQMTALRFALEDQGILTSAQKDSAMTRSLEIWGPRRKTIEAIGATEDTTLQDFLSSFEGPIQ
jgi:hypothetical protein